MLQKRHKWLQNAAFVLLFSAILILKDQKSDILAST